MSLDFLPCRVNSEINEFHSSEEAAERKHLDLPDADWSDIAIIMGDDLSPCIWEAIGYEGLTANGIDQELIDQFESNVFEGIRSNNAILIGQSILKFASPYVLSVASRKTATRALIRTNLDHLIDGLQAS